MLHNKLFRKIAIDRLSSPEELDQLMQVTTLRSWLILAALSGLFIMAAVWGIWGSLTTTAPGRGILVETAGTDGKPELQAIVYVSPQDALKIRPGMEVRVSPDTVNTEEYGFMRGKVVSVSDTPATAQEMQRVLNNDTLVKNLSQQNFPIEVTIALERDSSTPSGYRWYSAKGPQTEISNTTFCAVQIIIESQHPIELVLPGAVNP
jgi:hypothetical protein